MQLVTVVWAKIYNKMYVVFTSFKIDIFGGRGIIILCKIKKDRFGTFFMALFLNFLHHLVYNIFSNEPTKAECRVT